MATTSLFIAYCGLDCTGCPIRLATLESDPSKQRSMRNDIARICTEQYGMKLPTSDVTDCDGCRSTSGRLFSGCAKCEMRKCAIGKNLASCALCADYACDKLLKFLETDPTARGRLEGLRGSQPPLA